MKLNDFLKQLNMVVDSLHEEGYNDDLIEVDAFIDLGKNYEAEMNEVNRVTRDCGYTIYVETSMVVDKIEEVVK